MTDKDYIVIVQCDIVKERCSGYFCERAFHHRLDAFGIYSPERAYRTIHMTCGGCCGRALHRKLSHLVRKIRDKEGVDKSRIVVQLSSCITQDNYHGPACPHLDYLRTLISRVGLDCVEGTCISEKAESRRKAGIYQARPASDSVKRTKA
jgi:predicted metal-binding protein